MADPTVRFHGQPAAGFHALAHAMDHGLPVLSLRRYWDVIDGEVTGPKWEMTFRTTGPTDEPLVPFEQQIAEFRTT